MQLAFCVAYPYKVTEKARQRAVEKKARYRVSEVPASAIASARAAVGARLTLEVVAALDMCPREETAAAEVLREVNGSAAGSDERVFWKNGTPGAA